VDAKLRAEARRSGRPFKDLVNEYLRLGLNVRKQKVTVKPYVVKPVPLGLKSGYSYDNVWGLIEEIEQHERSGNS
jgi:hypothetical protein